VWVSMVVILVKEEEGNERGQETGEEEMGRTTLRTVFL